VSNETLEFAMERVDHTLFKLRQMIASNFFEHGGRVPPERELANELGIGRRSLRKALEILEQEGRILRQQGRGTFVRRSAALGEFDAASGQQIPAVQLAGNLSRETPDGQAYQHILDHTNPLEVIEVRLAIEPTMARLAAFRASQAEINRLQALAEETRLATDSATYREADGRFHRTIAEVARNSLFLAVYDTLHASQRDMGWRRLGENANCYKRQSVYAGVHREISSAIAARQGDRAQELMHQHLSDVQRYIFEHAFPAGTSQQ
jgi:DNA-binding FadR family transcriptional regulator